MSNYAVEILNEDLTSAVCEECGETMCQHNQEAKDVELLDQLESEISQLSKSALAIDNFGINQAAYQVLTITKLLSGTALEALLTTDVKSEANVGDTSQLAVEALLGKASEKLAQWSAKVLSVVAAGAKKVVDLLGSLWNVISGSLKTLTSMTWDAAKYTGKTIKAHPVATIVAVLAAAAAVSGIIVFCGGTFPGYGAALTAFETFMVRARGMVAGIKWPFGKVTTTVVKIDGKVFEATIENTVKAVPKEGSMSALGWTANQVKAVGAQITRVWTSFSGGIKKFYSLVSSPFKKISELGKTVAGAAGDTVKAKTGSRAAGWVAKTATGMVYGTIVWKFYRTIFNLGSKIIGGAFRMVRDTFRSLVYVLT